MRCAWDLHTCLNCDLAAQSVMTAVSTAPSPVSTHTCWSRLYEDQGELE